MCIENLSLSNLSPTNLAVSNLSLSNSSLSNRSPANVHIFILSLSNLLYQSSQGKPVGGNFQEVGKRYRKRKAYRNETRAAFFNFLAILFPWHLLLLETFSVDASPTGTFLLSAAPVDSSEARGLDLSFSWHRLHVTNLETSCPLYPFLLTSCFLETSFLLKLIFSRLFALTHISLETFLKQFDCARQAMACRSRWHCTSHHSNQDYYWRSQPQSNANCQDESPNISKIGTAQSLIGLAEIQFRSK